MLQVIGAGLGRTGTHSLAAALEKLGVGPCYTLPEVNKNPGLEATAQHPDPEIRARSSMQRRLILAQTFSGRYWEKAHAIEVYQAHVQDVIEMVPGHRLLQFRVADGWSPLCEFLEVGEPEEPFPRRNERASFLASAPDWAVKVMGKIREKREDG